MHKQFSSIGEFVQYSEAKSPGLRRRRNVRSPSQQARSRSKSRSRSKTGNPSSKSRSNLSNGGGSAIQVRSNSDVTYIEQNAGAFPRMYQGFKNRVRNCFQYVTHERRKGEVRNREVADDSPEWQSTFLIWPGDDNDGDDDEIIQQSTASQPAAGRKTRRHQSTPSPQYDTRSSSVGSHSHSDNILLRTWRNVFHYITHERQEWEVRNRDVSFEDSRAWRLAQPEYEDLTRFASSWTKNIAKPPLTAVDTKIASRRGRPRSQATASSLNANAVMSHTADAGRGRLLTRAVRACTGLCWRWCAGASKSADSINVNSLIKSIRSEESSLSILTQVTLPFIIAGFGTVGAGMVLDVVQHWDVFIKVSEIFILVPALLGLKGNLEMTLASRLSTQCNLGNMDHRSELIKMVGGNMCLVQAQAIVVGFLAALTAMVMGWIPEGKWDMEHGLLLCASSLFTACVASLVLGIIMVVVILISRKVNINPDNVATPIAASLGDLVTLSLLAWVGNLLFEALGREHWIAPTLISFFLLLLPLWVVICVRNSYTKDVIANGWTPVLSAMMISSVGGLILDYTVANYNGIAVFQPVINGVGGNLVAVQASRISTTLHQKGSPSPEGQTKKLAGCLSPITAFFGKGVHSRAACVLTLLTIPGHLLFVYTIYYMKAGHTTMSPMFQVFYLTAALLQVILLLYTATWLVPLIWVKGSDPDNVAIPYLTALGDLLGTAFLAVAFHMLFLIGDRDADVGD